MMLQNIKNNYHRKYKTKLRYDEYFDFILYNGDIYEENKLNDKLSVNINVNSLIDNKLYSNVNWVNAINDGIELYDNGFTNMDNGFISYEKDEISNKEFLNLLINSTLKIDRDDTRFFLTQVTGNTQDYIYPLEMNNDYMSLKGGFFQGFFKLHNEKYEVLPSKITEEMNINISLRPRSDYKIEEGTMNDLHPENSGFFFYIGTRAENKFYPFYNVSEDSLNRLVKENTSNDGYMVDGDFVYNGVVHDQYMSDRTGYEPEECDLYFMDDYFNGKAEMVFCDCNSNCHNNGRCDYCNEYDRNDEYHNNEDDYFKKNECKSSNKCDDNDIFCKDKNFNINDLYDNNITSDSVNCCNGTTNGYSNCGCGNSCGLKEMKRYDDSENCLCESYFGDDYFDNQCNDTGNFLPSEYIEEEVEINPEQITDSEGRNYTKKGYYEIKTDNKFLLFNRTKTGFTVNDWVEGAEVTLTGRTDWDNYNYYLLMDRTKNGYNVNTINDYNEKNRRSYNIYKDIVNNALGFRIKEDGSIGYRYATYDCENEDKYGIIEEYSLPNIVKDNEWSKIHIKIKPIDNCKKMQLYFYVNGYLKLISKELTMINLKPLNDVKEKQECVPYNISLGGGTQGLLEVIYPDYYNQPQFILPLERDFCGTFIGDIKSLKIYNGFLDNLTIKNYL